MSFSLRVPWFPRRRPPRVLSLLGCGILGLAAGAPAARQTPLHIPAPLHPSSSLRAADTVTPEDIRRAAAEDTLVPTSTPWAPTDWRGRVVIGEIGAGWGCWACQVPMHVYDALLRRYPATAFVALEYHDGEFLPGGHPDDSLFLRLSRWYGLQGATHAQIGGAFPRADWDYWIDGRAFPFSADTQQVQAYFRRQDLRGFMHYLYAQLTARIDAELQQAPQSVLHVQAVPNGGTVGVTVRVDALASGHPQVAVRILLVEDTVQLTRDPKSSWGGNVRKNFYMVVRGANRDATHALGVPLHGPATVTYTFDVATYQRTLLHYWRTGLTLDTAKLKAGPEWEVKKAVLTFPAERNWRVDPTRLHVVAMVQDLQTGDILQAQMVKVDTGPHGERLTLR